MGEGGNQTGTQTTRQGISPGRCFPDCVKSPQIGSPNRTKGRTPQKRDSRYIKRFLRFSGPSQIWTPPPKSRITARDAENQQNSRDFCAHLFKNPCFWGSDPEFTETGIQRTYLPNSNLLIVPPTPLVCLPMPRWN